MFRNGPAVVAARVGIRTVKVLMWWMSGHQIFRGRWDLVEDISVDLIPLTSFWDFDDGCDIQFTVMVFLYIGRQSSQTLLPSFWQFPIRGGYFISLWHPPRTYATTGPPATDQSVMHWFSSLSDISSRTDDELCDLYPFVTFINDLYTKDCGKNTNTTIVPQRLIGCVLASYVSNFQSLSG
jgi:hypothetical protein